MVRPITVLSALAACGALACGSAKNNPETPPPSGAEVSSAVDPAANPSASDSAASDAAASASEAPKAESAPAAKSDPAPADSDYTPRDVKYIVSPGKLDVEVEGVRLTATAEAIKSGAGWGVRVKAVAKAKDGKPHHVLTPKNGPLAFAGSVTHAGKSERFGDKREGDTGRTLTPTGTQEFTREWPDKGASPLRTGDELELEVGLWGIGDSEQTRRPLLIVLRKQAELRIYR